MRIILLLFLIFYGCRNNNSKYINSYQIPKEPSVSFNLHEMDNIPFTWETPINWIPNNKSTIRTASYLIPFAKGSADLSVTHFPGDAGGVTANVNRWRKQLNLPEITKREIELNSQNFKSNIGSYQIYKIINPEHKEAGFLCAIIPANNFTIFIKLNSYPETIDNLMGEFIEFSSSFKYNE